MLYVYINTIYIYRRSDEIYCMNLNNGLILHVDMSRNIHLWKNNTNGDYWQ